MCNTKTKDIESTINQILELEKAGCQIIRVACLNKEDAKAIRFIKQKIHIPIVADIHFDYQIALEAIEAGVDKIRINPGNIGNEEKVKAVVDACKKHNIPIRIGVNAGSLEKDLLEKEGKPTVNAMIESAKRHIEILEKLDFYNYVISLKASNLDLCISAYEQASKEFKCPLHLGITEAGTEFSGTVKSSIGLGVLLRQGIGDTIRVSLSDEPIKEIKVAMEIIIGKTSGFCYGVGRAINGAINEISKTDGNICCLGEIVHNGKVVKNLENMGIKFIEEIEEVKEKEEVLIRAHGVPKEIYKYAEKMGIEIKDYTCPNVLRIHDIANKYSEDNFFIFLLGSKKHPENIGTISHCGKKSSNTKKLYEIAQNI
ncbi:MAG: (E)-4-hydroxy-3-methylbut-2-enyl-diphosphate synthase [Clostridia bacterium]|nr:(E)-4-hydroxy-3-methylbut-2-enyl-diphosphate synthase [Clostridia bacterium]